MGITSSRLFFLHIPKTAGTSFREYLEWFFAPAQICKGFSESSINHLAGIERPVKSFYSGHVTFDYIDYFFKEYEWLTVLRNPVSRTVSQFLNWTDVESHQSKWIDEDRDGSLRVAIDLCSRIKTAEDFISSPNILMRGVVFNPITRSLVSGNVCPDIFFVDDYYNEDLVHEAVCNLVGRFKWFGIVERFEQSLKLLGQQYLHVPRVVQSKNAARRYEVTASDLRAITKVTRMDMEVYRQAEKVFLGRCEETLGEEMWYTEISEIERSSLGDKCFSIAANSGRIADGWGFLESGRNGIPYRWSEGGEDECSDIVVPASICVDRIKMITYGGLSAETVASVRAFINDSPLELLSVREGNYGVIFEWTSASTWKAEAKDGLCMLRFRSAKKVISGTGASRCIGFAIHRVDFYEL
jgi:hypothetical protein